MFNALELLLVVLALGVIAVGLSRRWHRLGLKPAVKPKADWPGLFAAVLMQRNILDRPLVGLAHLSLVWGFIIFILIVIIAQTPLMLPPVGAWGVSLALDIIGLLMLVSGLFLLLRRILRNSRKTDQRPPKRTLLPLILLLVVLISGFFAEGTRLNILDAQPLLAAPLGRLCASFLPAAPQFMQAMLRVHFVFVILFFITLPFTFMRHLGSTTVNILYKNKMPPQLPSPVSLTHGPLGAATVADFNPAQLRETEACVSCGRCDEQCPALISGKPLSPRTIMGKIVDQLESWPPDRSAGSTESTGTTDAQPRLADTIDGDEVWACTTCMACVAACPVAIRPMDKLLELRRNRVLENGALPAEAVAAMRNLELFGDVNGKGVAHKHDWALNRNVSRIADKTDPPELLLWVGCSGAFHPEYQETTRALVKVLKAAGVDFAVLAQEELCCGDPARKLGDEALFQDLARRNIQCLQAHGIQRIVTLCPHCFNTLGQEYSELGLEAEVLHAAQLVDQWIDQGRIQMKYPGPGIVAVHDPCYLGRYSGIYNPLRRICSAVPGVTIKEPDRSRDKGFCCGGGGGRMWLHETLGEKINHVRAREMTATGADAIATACPYCLTMMADGVTAMEGEQKPEVIDIIKMAADALG